MTDRMTTKEVLDAIARERRHLDEAIAALHGGVDSVPITEDGWTAKDVVAHLIHWASQIAWGMGAKLEPPAYVREAKDPPTDDDGWNALAVAHWRSASFAQVQAEFDRVVDALIVQVRLRGDDQMNAAGAISWAPPDKALWRLIGGETFAHWPVHARDIERATSLGVT